MHNIFTRFVKTIKKASLAVALKAIDLYQYILSPFTGNQCRFHPTCSCYMKQALKKHGFLKGIFLGSKRICKCHPYYKGEYTDNVPERFEWRDIFRYKRNANKKLKCNH